MDKTYKENVVPEWYVTSNWKRWKRIAKATNSPPLACGYWERHMTADGQDKYDRSPNLKRSTKTNRF